MTSCNVKKTQKSKVFINTLFVTVCFKKISKYQYNLRFHTLVHYSENINNSLNNLKIYLRVKGKMVVTYNNKQFNTYLNFVFNIT